MEIWDAYKEDGTLAGCNLIRGEEIPKGLFHLVSEIIVKHKDGMYLLMQRDWKKPNFPGLYEASAGGSALKGEQAYDAAVRELKEETGIEAKKLKLIYKGMSKHAIFYGYLCETDCDKDSITLQEGETISYLWMAKEDFLKFVESDKYIQPYKERMNEYLDSIR
ncbi:NUDIX domain-containing protein [Clostridium sp.]|uniref:NUDIX hydrolase n=1 Tax=Clostridium sp. TaxID=1506 RepID=UPI00284207DA|nr:NUDIX domain-containing protein [Clostridium sp.]MDR3597884.1 NUDIX domain-containing protein [Clostridium sp.]